MMFWLYDLFTSGLDRYNNLQTFLFHEGFSVLGKINLLSKSAGPPYLRKKCL